MRNKIQWFPGHMPKGLKMLKEYKKVINLFVELVDARAPLSTKIDDFYNIFENKYKILIFNKSDLSDSTRINELLKSFPNYDEVHYMNLKNSKDVSKLKKILIKFKDKKNKLKNTNIPLRIMVCGIPNVGKSTLIKGLAGGKKINIENRPGVTRGKQLVRIAEGIELVDSPGILLPSYEDQDRAANIALIGSITDKVLDSYSLSFTLIDKIKKYESMFNYYGIDKDLKETYEIFDAIGKKRGNLKKGGIVDEDKTSKTIITDFRKGLLGKITID